VEIRQANAQKIVTLNQRGQLVYKNGAPALLEASLSRLGGLLKGQVLHCEDAAYNACKSTQAKVHRLDLNGSHIDDITKMYRDDNYDPQYGTPVHEVAHYQVDYHLSELFVKGHESMAFWRNFVSRLHVAQYFNTSPDADCILSTSTLTDEQIVAAGFEVESIDWEHLNHRAGGPTLAKIKHTVWRHRSARPSPLFSLDNTAWAAQATERSAADLARRGDGRYYREAIVDPTISFVLARGAQPVAVALKQPKPAAAPVLVKSGSEFDAITGMRRPVWG
jgi:hypothetical protein